MQLTPPRCTFPLTQHSSRVSLRRRLHLVALAATTLLLCAPAPAEDLKPQPIGTYARLLQLLKEHPGQDQSGVSPSLPVNSGSVGVLPTTAATPTAPAYSQTRVQVAGVDETDPVKTDGTHIYRLDQNRLSLIRVHAGAQLSLTKVLDFNQGNFAAQGLLLDSQFLVVVGTATREPAAQPGWGKWARRFPFLQNNTVQAKVYDITHPAHPQKVREVEIDGDYVGTRKIGSTLYLVSSHYPLCYAVGFQAPLGLRLATPGFRDSRQGKGFRALGPQFCYYLSGFYDPRYLVVAAVDLAKDSARLSVNAYLGAGAGLYASTENLYVTASRSPFFWGQVVVPITGPGVMVGSPVPGGFVFSPGLPFPQPGPIFNGGTEKTEIYKFSLAAGTPQFVSAASVPGTVLNAYSMDEHHGYLRVATTSGGWWGGFTNQLYVLDSHLNLTGQLEGLAPGEKIYSARFLSNRLFLVTFEHIDPLLAIDLSDPAHPVLAGQLTLPGFSNFLLPYDENHLIGLGKEVDPDGVYQQGMKLALFDVSDLANPTLLSGLSLGDRGTDSPALQDPHALLFDRTRNLLAFPITVAAVTNTAGPWLYGDTVFQGAYVFNVSPEAGFEFRGAVTHMPEGSNLWDDWTHQISRVLTIGSDLFTLSPAQVKANDVDTLAEKATLNLPVAPVTGPSPAVFPARPGQPVFGNPSMPVVPF